MYINGCGCLLEWQPGSDLPGYFVQPEWHEKKFANACRIIHLNA